jgi:large subunit ribosomal protein L29
MKTTKELRNLSVAEMKTRKEELQKELLKMNAQVAMGTNPQSPGKVKQAKKNIARILTLIKEKEVKER